MKRLVRFFLLGCIGFLSAEIPSLENFREVFSRQMDSLGAERDGRLGSLQSAYLDALRRLDHQTRQTGDLDSLLQIRNEIKRVVEASGLPPDFSSHPPLADLQRTLARSLQQEETEHALRVQQAVEKAREFSRQATAGVLRAGDVDGAIAWRSWGNDLDQYLLPMLGSSANRLSPAVRLLSARYGARDRWLKVTEIVQEALDPESGLQIAGVSNEWAGSDPLPGVPKVLEITFVFRGKTWMESAEEGQPLNRTVEQLHTKALGLLGEQ